MTYYSGTQGLGNLGIADSNPRVVCDGCGVVKRALKVGGFPYAWFVHGQAPPGWKLLRNVNGRFRTDLCKRCVADGVEPEVMR